MGGGWVDLDRRSTILFLKRGDDNGDEVCDDLEEEVIIGSEKYFLLRDELITEDGDDIEKEVKLV